MNLQEFNTLPDGIIPANAERLLQVAKFQRDMETKAYKSFSGADIADAPIHGFVADALGCIAQGKQTEAVLALFDSKWRAYADENHAKVNSAPKIKRGPRSGQSSIEHRYVNSDAWQSKASFIRSLLK